MHGVKQCPCLKASLHPTFVWCFGCLRRPPLTDSHCQCSYTDNRAAGLRGDQGNTKSDCLFCKTFLFKTSIVAVLVLLSLPKACIKNHNPKKKKKEKWSSSFRLNSLARISFLFGMSWGIEKVCCSECYPYGGKEKWKGLGWKSIKPYFSPGCYIKTWLCAILMQIKQMSLYCCLCQLVALGVPLQPSS